MGSCDALQVHGHMESRKIGRSDRQLILSLKPSTELREELCGFCDEKWDSESDLQSRTSKHAHSLKGTFSFIPSENQFIFTLTDCGRNITDDNEDYTPAELQEESEEKSLRYEVDGKVYELRSSLPMKRMRPKFQQDIPQPIKEPTPKKTIEFVIEDKIYSTTSLGSKPYEETCDMSAGVNDERSSLDMSLALLQVKLMEKSIIPERIDCGPDTATFLNNMRQLAKLVTPAGQNSFRCEQCADDMTSYFAYIEHAFKHFGTRPYVCAICQSSFQSRAVMRHHLDMHGGKAPFVCDYCGKKFRNSSHMKQHRMRHTGEKPHNCPHCDKTFAHKNVLKIHLQTHTGQKPCCCDLCGKLFREPHRLACHLATHYRSSKSLECPTCGKTFKMKGMLKLHEARHCKDSGTGDETETENGAMLETLQNANLVDDMDQHHLLEGEQEVTIIEAETLEDGTMILPVNTYIVEPMLVQFSIEQDDAQVIAGLDKEDELEES